MEQSSGKEELRRKSLIRNGSIRRNKSWEILNLMTVERCVDFHALKNVNMQINEHEITAFIGPSGCGKSTFLKTLNRMNDLVENCKIEGSVCLDGVDIYKNMDEITLRHRVGMVFQQPNPFPKSVYDNVAYGPQDLWYPQKSQAG